MFLSVSCWIACHGVMGLEPATEFFLMCYFFCCFCEMKKTNEIATVASVAHLLLLLLRLFPLEAEMALYPSAAVSTRRFVLAAWRRPRRRRCCQLQEIWLALPLVFRQKEGLGEEVLGGTDVLGDRIGADVAAAESRPLFGAQSPTIVFPVWTRTFKETRMRTYRVVQKGNPCTGILITASKSY